MGDLLEARVEDVDLARVEVGREQDTGGHSADGQPLVDGAGGRVVNLDHRLGAPVPGRDRAVLGSEDEREAAVPGPLIGKSVQLPLKTMPRAPSPFGLVGDGMLTTSWHWRLSDGDRLAGTGVDSRDALAVVADPPRGARAGDKHPRNSRG